MNKQIFTSIFILICSSVFAQINSCGKTLTVNEIHRIETIPFTKAKTNVLFLHKIINSNLKDFPELQTKHVDYKIRDSEEKIFDFYGFVDKQKIEKLICNIKTQRQIPKGLKLLFHEFDTGNILSAFEISN